MKNKSLLNLSAIFLIIFNSVPLLGVIFFNWSLFNVLFLYWAENLVIGFYNVLKMSKAQGIDSGKSIIEPKELNRKSYLIPFFIFHYGMFTLVHGIFLVSIFGLSNIFSISILIGIVSLFISHGISYIGNFIQKEEYKIVSPGTLFGQPYSRILIMHVVVLFSGFVIQRFDLPILSVVLLVILKTITDLKLHQLEHKKFQANFRRLKKEKDASKIMVG